MKKSFKLMLLAFIAVFLNSCVSLVKPGINKVKKVAIVSVQSNKSIYGKDLNGNNMLTITSLASGIEAQKKEGNPFIAKILSKTAEYFAKEMGGTAAGFQFIMGSEVTNNPAYATFVNAVWSNGGGKTAQDLEGLNKQAMAGYQVILNSGNFSGNDNRSKALKAAAVDLAKALNVDAVAMIDMDIYYKVTAEILGSGAADAKTSVSIAMINNEGEEAISGWIAPQSQGEGPLGLIANNVLLNNDTAPIFERSARKGIDEIIEKVNKGAK